MQPRSSALQQLPIENGRVAKGQRLPSDCAEEDFGIPRLIQIANHRLMQWSIASFLGQHTISAAARNLVGNPRLHREMGHRTRNSRL